MQRRHAVRRPALGIRRRERDEDIARAVAAESTLASDAQRDARGDALELMREEGRVGRDDDDDRTQLLSVHAATGPGLPAPWPSRIGCLRFLVGDARLQIGDLLANRNAGDPQIAARAEVALHQNTDR